MANDVPRHSFEGPSKAWRTPKRRNLDGRAVVSWDNRHVPELAGQVVDSEALPIVQRVLLVVVRGRTPEGEGDGRTRHGIWLDHRRTPGHQCGEMPFRVVNVKEKSESLLRTLITVCVPWSPT